MKQVQDLPPLDKLREPLAGGGHSDLAGLFCSWLSSEFPAITVDRSLGTAAALQVCFYIQILLFQAFRLCSLTSTPNAGSWSLSDQGSAQGCSCGWTMWFFTCGHLLPCPNFHCVESKSPISSSAWVSESSSAQPPSSFRWRLGRNMLSPAFYRHPKKQVKRARAYFGSWL